MASFQAGGITEQLATTATAAGTTTLTVTSHQIQVFTGSTTQTVVLPNATTMFVGQKFEIVNQSTGSLTLHFNGGGSFTDAAGNAYGTILTGSSLYIQLQTNGTSAGTWAVISSLGTATTISGTITSSNVTTATFIAPTVRTLTTGTAATYTTPTSPRTPLYLRVRMVGGGGGGSGGGSATPGTAPTSGGNTTFGTSLLVANGGSAGSWQGVAGAGGTASLGSGPLGTAVTGSGGQGGSLEQGSVGQASGGSGGASPFGGAGAGANYNNTGGAAAANSGSGGGAGGSGAAATTIGGSGGGSGGFVDALITSPTTSYSYSIGSAGGAGGAGTGGNAGGAGGSGYIIVEEFYQ